MRAFLIPLITLSIAAAPLFAVEQSDYMPLSDGWEWTMTVQTISSKGATKTGIAHRKVEGQVEKNGKLYYRVHTWTDGTPFRYDDTAIARKDDLGCYATHESEKDAKDMTDLLFPIKVGQSWQSATGNSIVKNTIIALESITVDGKTYDNCCHIRSAWPEFTEDNWEAPGIGSVKDLMVFGNGAKILFTLKEFKPGK